MEKGWLLGGGIRGKGKKQEKRAQEIKIFFNLLDGYKSLNFSKTKKNVLQTISPTTENDATKRIVMNYEKDWKNAEK